MLTGRLRRFLDRTEALRADADPEAVHQLRVAARRLQAALRTFAPLVEIPVAVRPRPFRRVERRLGRLRDLDVLLERLPEGEREAADIRQRLERERATSLGRVEALLRRRRLADACRGLAEWLEEPNYTPLGAEPLAASGPDLLAPALGRTLIHPGWGMPDLPDPTDPAARPLHALRRRVKALRYAVECLAEWLPPEADQWLAELHAMQDALGTWHDEGLLLDLLADCAEVDALKRAARERARAAIADWPAWRARYRSPAGRAALRAVVLRAAQTGDGAAAGATG